MSLANPLWDAPRVHDELLKLGIEISQTTVATYMPTASATISELAGLPRQPPQGPGVTDFFTVPSATFRVLFAFVVLAHDRRRVVHFNVT